LIACDADEWILPFMSAHIEYQTDCEIEGEKFSMIFVSRRSRFRQGCRFTKRGIDEAGNVANFVETEQILQFVDNKITSYVQIRGSIPIPWASPVHMKYAPVVYLDENRPNSISCCEKHVMQILHGQWRTFLLI
jgi:SacI homology domain